MAMTLAARARTPADMSGSGAPASPMGDANIRDEARQATAAVANGQLYNAGDGLPAPMLPSKSSSKLSTPARCRRTRPPIPDLRVTT